MGLVEKIMEAIIAIFIIFVFAVFVFPALGQATGQSVILPIAILVLLAVTVIIGIAIAIIKFFQG
jgi:uncharacterized membrane protein